MSRFTTQDLVEVKIVVIRVLDKSQPTSYQCQKKKKMHIAAECKKARQNLIVGIIVQRREFCPRLCSPRQRTQERKGSNLKKKGKRGRNIRLNNIIQFLKFKNTIMDHNKCIRNIIIVYQVELPVFNTKS